MWLSLDDKLAKHPHDRNLHHPRHSIDSPTKHKTQMEIESITLLRRRRGLTIVLVIGRRRRSQLVVVDCSIIILPTLIINVIQFTTWTFLLPSPNVMTGFLIKTHSR